MSGTITIFYGAVVTPIDTRTWRAMPRCLLAVGSTGNIDWIFEHVDEAELKDALLQKGHQIAEVVTLKRGEFIIPGFVDTHTHAPQFPNLGCGGQYELLDWLNKVTFPTEAQFKNEHFARKTYPDVVRRLLDSGTTTCCYYATLHPKATKILAETIRDLGQRAFVGKCNMDRECPSDYVEKDARKSLADTEDVISHIRSLSPVSSHSGIGTAPEPLVQPILTPRFAISCTGELLDGLHKLADKYDGRNSNEPRMRIQTHVSENKSEIAYTLKLYPNAKSYADVYDSHGILRDTTILAHAVHLTDEEIQLVKSRNAGISHCPTSNFNLRSGVAPIGRFLDEGIKVGLGTDVSGGYAVSMLNAVQSASIASKIVSMNSPPASSPPKRALLEPKEDVGTSSSLPSPDGSVTSASIRPFANRHLPIETLFYLATLGGADVCGLAKRIGSISRGKSFDALVVSVLEAEAIGVWGKGETTSHTSDRDTGTINLYVEPIGVWGKGAETSHISDRDAETKKLEENLERFLFCGDDRNITRVYVQGRLVGGRSFHK